MRQKNQVMLNLGTGETGEARNTAAQEAETGAAKACLERPAAGEPSMEAIVERNNLRKALKQVQRNKGEPGADGMTIGKLAPYLKEHWPTIRAQLLEGSYDVLRGKLRLSAAALGASGGGSGARVHRVWSWRRCGHRPGEIFRPGQPRHPDGAGGQTGDRQAHPEARPRLSHCGSAD